MYFLIDNANQECLVFATMRELKEYAKKKGCKPKKSPLSINSYWLDNAL